MRLLITGSRGFVGASVGIAAADAGHEVLGVDLSAQPVDGWQGAYQQADVAHADLAHLIDEFRPDTVIHAAGSASVGGSYDDPVGDLRAAALTFANALDGVRRARRRPLVIFPSSAAVYGNPAHLPVAEDAPVSPISPYGFHKAVCELLAREYATCFQLDVVVARLFSVYGPRQRRLLLWELYDQAAGGSADVVLQGTGGETRDYLHVDDVARIFLAFAARRPVGLTLANVASGHEVSTLELARAVVAAVGADKPVRTLGQVRQGDPLNWRADVKQTAGLGVVPRELLDGVRECVAAWRNA
ncbi:MAG: NAD-dependent epimerase/dehydratase family protein [Nitrospirota bacterium]|nr:NAD-dependent epimerase/dehydratase family protein [Nitrospirota bacterium]